MNLTLMAEQDGRSYRHHAYLVVFTSKVGDLNLINATLEGTPYYELNATTAYVCNYFCSTDLLCDACHYLPTGNCYYYSRKNINKFGIQNNSTVGLVKTHFQLFDPNF